jgi:hypothetical protein
LANLSAVDGGKGKHFIDNCQCRLLVQTARAKTQNTNNAAR